METGVQGGGESAEQGQEQQQQPPGDSRLLEEFEKFRTDVNSRFDQLQQDYYAGDDDGDYEGGEEEDQPADEIPDDGGEPQFAADDFDQYGNVTPEAQARALRGVMEQTFAEMIAPHVEDTQRIREERRQEKNDAYADYLEATYPDLQDADVQNEIIEKAKVLAGYYAETMERPELAELARSPQFIEQVYLAEQAKNGKGAAGAAGPEVQLETGGSAGPAAPELDDDAIGDRIVKAGGKRFRLGTGG